MNIFSQPYVEDKMPKQHEVYEPNQQLHLGVRIWLEMFRELGESRELIWRFFVRDFVAQYKQTMLGYLWAFLAPFIALTTFIFLKKAGILNIGLMDVPYPVFALIGVSVWGIFTTGIVAGTNSITGTGPLISKINFPREALVFSAVLQSVVEFLIKCGLILLSFILCKYRPSWGILLFPIAVLPMFFFTLGLSLILSLMNVIIRDAAKAISMLTTFLLFVTPVLYPVSFGQTLFFDLNPLSALVNAPRDLVLYGTIKDPVIFAVSSTLSLLIFLMGWRIFHLVSTKIPERI